MVILLISIDLLTMLQISCGNIHLDFKYYILRFQYFLVLFLILNGIFKLKMCVATPYLCLGGSNQQGAVGVGGGVATSGNQYSARWTTWRDCTMFPTGCQPRSSGIT
jgi:hypothetical protein